MKDDTQESGHRRRYFRYAVFTLAALLVVSLGFVLIPREPDVPAPPPFSEQARAAAFSDAAALSTAAADLAGTPDGASPAAGSADLSAAVSSAIGRTVTLLTVQARALMLPAEPSGVGAPSASASSAPVPLASTPADLAAALHASGAQRLTDAQTADGGMARLLAGAGTAQLLAAGEIAAAAGIALDKVAGPARPSPESSSREPTPTAGCTATVAAGSASPGGAGPSSGETDTAAADLASSIAAVTGAELELVYAYQAALTRLDSGSVAPASEFLDQHEELRDEAEAKGGARCAALPPTPAGYAVDEAFLSDPAGALGAMEAATLPVYGDVIALSDGAERAWAVSALQSATRRTVHWGAPAGPVPGVVLDDSRLPELPGAAPTQGPAPTSSGQP